MGVGDASYVNPRNRIPVNFETAQEEGGGPEPPHPVTGKVRSPGPLGRQIWHPTRKGLQDLSEGMVDDNGGDNESPRTTFVRFMRSTRIRS